MDDPVVRPLLPAFAKALSERIALMNVLLCGGDAVEVARIAHMIRGSAGSYGYAQVAQLAGQIETGARGGSRLADIGPLIADLARMSEGVNAAVAAMDTGTSDWNRGFRDEGGVD
jgi:HPt (histidine-containing phosphotransfer) domain-containing protein